jgi:transcriptional regulator GlxA family with amidase domain
VNKARQWVVAHCEDSVSLAAAAQAVNLSAKHFSDVFRKATGIPFVEYVGRVRVEKAKNLLVNPQLRISEIAFEVGFESFSQFNRAFRRHAGMSPRDCRHALLGAANPQKTGKMRSLSGMMRRATSDPLASCQSSDGHMPIRKNNNSNWKT